MRYFLQKKNEGDSRGYELKIQKCTLTCKPAAFIGFAQNNLRLNVFVHACLNMQKSFAQFKDVYYLKISLIRLNLLLQMVNLRSYFSLNPICSPLLRRNVLSSHEG